MPSQSAKNFCFTVNNPKVPPEEWIEDFFNKQKPAYVIVGLEKGESETPHLQGYCSFAVRRRFAPMAKLYDAHFEVAKGGLSANIDYCSKDGDVYERGSREEVAIQGGKRTSKEEAVIILNEIKNKRSRLELFDDMPWQYKQINAMGEKRPDRCVEPRLLYIWGKTGHGKTTTTRKVLKELGKTAYWKPSAIKWWNGYDHQEVVVLEEFASCFPVTSFLQLTDPTPMQVEFKGGMIKFDSPYIIVLSNTAPDCQYLKVADDNKSRHDAYLRRVENHLETEPDNHELIRATIIDFLSTEPIPIE